jgi:hypothetical protein
MSPDETNQLNRSLDILYSNKIEGKWKRETTGIKSYPYWQQEAGEVNFSATGSATVAQTFALQEKHSRIIFASAHAKSTLVHAVVTDVTASSITVTCRTISGTADFSSVTTATIPVFFTILSSDS